MSSTLPDILNVKTLPTISNMEIKTEVLDPITSSTSEIVFQIPKNGILDGGSFVSLAITTASGVSDAFLPLQTGIHGLIKSAFLMSGSKVIASTEDYGHYATMIRQFETPEHRAYVEQVKSGNSMDRFSEIDTATGRIMPKDLQYNTFAVDNTATAVVPTFIKPTDNDNTTPVFSVPLSQLIPFMRSRQLPLFAMKENVFLRLILNTQSTTTDGTICCFPDSSASSGIITPSFNNIKFYSDHLYYPQDTMNATTKAIYSDGGLSYIYEDSLLTTHQLPEVADPTSPAITEQKIERDIAVSGKVVRSILISEKETGASHNLLGLYHSEADLTDREYNFRINEQRYYDRDVKTPSMKYTELSKVMVKPLQVPQQLYSLDADTNKSNADNTLNQNSVYIGKIEGHQLPNGTNTARTTDIRGMSHYTGVDLTTTGFNVLGNGKRIGVKPIVYQCTEKRTAGKNQAREIRFYSNVERVITIKNGDVVVSA
tara:strand:+ start:121 stop:1575 length:1455 start_codon:yes stop_codon:yes gene_type:complete